MASVPLTEPQGHVFVLDRFIASGQIYGGITLAVAYLAGSPTAEIPLASTSLVALGLVQFAVGLTWLAYPQALRAVIVRRPGAVVAAVLSQVTLILLLGGTTKDTLFATSVICWLIAAGNALPAYRWLVAGSGAAVVVGAVWWATDDGTGGYAGDGDLITAFVGLAACMFPGLWIGRAAGETFFTLDRWHAVERHERGSVQSLRDRMKAVDDRAAEVGRLLGDRGDAADLASLRARLALGVGGDTASATTTVGRLLADLAERPAESGVPGQPRRTFAVTAPDEVLQIPLSAAVSDAVGAVVRRQLGNVERHVPWATRIDLVAASDGAVVSIGVEDDGAAALPTEHGIGTAWSRRQLARVGGTAEYYAGSSGVGLQIVVPRVPAVSLSDVPGLSVSAGVDRFAKAFLGSVRWVSYVIDTLAAHAAVDEIGLWWLAMPLGAVAIEVLLRREAAVSRRFGRPNEAPLSALLAIALTAGFAWPAGSPELLVPASTGACVLAQLVYQRRLRWWGGLELLRLVAVAPFVWRHGAGTIELALVYPLGLSALVFALTRFADRARVVEQTAADAAGRAALAVAAVHGLSLHHDAVDVITRGGEAGDDLRAAMAGLESALRDLTAEASGQFDPREATMIGLRASRVPVASAENPQGDPRVAARIGVELDRLTLIELAALAAAERATCAPPGILGRRRLQSFAAGWTHVAWEHTSRLTLEACPTLRAPDPEATMRLEAVAATLGVEVTSTAASLELTYPAR